MQIRRLHHITVAVRDLDAALSTFATLFGANVAAPAADVAAFEARVLDADLAGTLVRFAAPAGDEGALSRFLERKGEGVYSIALEVADLDASVRELNERGVRVSDPVETRPGTRSAFVTMAASHGVSVELIESGDTRATSSEIPAPEPAPVEPPLLDLTPDEWSDTD